MSFRAFPFAAITGQPQMQLALLLASIDWRLSVLLKGDKGSGKSTAARALAGILPDNAPFVNLPIGTTEDRLLGGLDLGQALEGQARLKPGLIHGAHGGVLYIDEVNLLADALADALLDVSSSGRHYVERDGLSASADAHFVLLGSMNIEEGALRPQLLDRFALSVDVEAPVNAEERAQIVSRRIDFDTDPVAFCAGFEEKQQHLKDAVRNARSLAPGIVAPRRLIEEIASSIIGAGVKSLRADVALLRASIARAALEGRSEVTTEDTETVLPLVLHHRAKHRQPMPPQPDRGTKPDEPPPQSSGGSSDSPSSRIFPSKPTDAPDIRITLSEAVSRGRTAAVEDVAPQSKLDVVASLAQSFRQTGSASLQADRLVFRTPATPSGVRYLFVVDASGSQAAQQRMSAVKGTVQALLNSVDPKDEVAVITFRGTRAEIVLEPCRDVDRARRALEFLPTGGRTPLGHALELAGSLVTASTLLILLTDGRANVSLKGDDPWADALEAAANLNCPAVIVDSAPADAATSMDALVSATGAFLVRIEEASEQQLIRVLDSYRRAGTSKNAHPPLK